MPTTATRIPLIDSSVDRTRAYAEAVVAGEIVAGPHVRNACRRHLRDLEVGRERGLWFDHEAADERFAFFEEVLRLSEGQFDGQPFKLHPSQAFIVGSLFGWKRADGTRRFRRAYIEQGKGNGKALALDTPIPTPAGWTTMGAIQTGDEVLDDSGAPCRVLYAHPISDDRVCYRVEFDDGEVIVASAEHLWQTEMRTATKAGESRATKGVPKSQWGSWRHGLRSTSEIAKTLRYANGKYQSANHSVALCGALALPDVDLPIEPYMLGVWLGDGDSDGARITIGEDDAPDAIRVIKEAGWDISEPRDLERYRVKGLQKKLRAVGLLGNKHIPAAYLRASIAQRRALLQGLMDTDGYISAAGQCEFTQVKRELAAQVFELVLSLGIKATMLTGVATLGGREIGPKFRVIFHPREDQPCFRLPRKLARQAKRHSRRRLSGSRRIVACERVAPVPVRCITVDSPSSMFLAGRSLVPTHNSPLAGGIGLLGLSADGEAGAQIYAAAAKREQAGILFADAVKMVKQSPALKKRLQFSGGEGREFNIAHHPSGSFFRPVSRDTGKTGSGPRPYFVLADEVHELPDRTILETLERGFKFRRQPLLLMITNSGSDRNSVAWEEHEHAVKVAAGHTEAVNDPTFVGEPLDDSTFSFVCSLDEGDDPLTDPSCWAKANPLLGVTITHDYLAGVVAQGRAIPGKLNGIMRLHFCIWTDAESAWMTREALEPRLAEFEPSIHASKPVFLGLDLSQNRDITALAAVVPTGLTTEGKPTFDAWVEAWTPGDTIAARELRDKLPYSVWRDQGHLHAPQGESISYLHVAQSMVEYQRQFDIKAVAYDRYAFKRFETEAESIGLALPYVEHPQGGIKKGKPTEAMIEAAKREKREPDGLWMPGSLRLLEDAILEGRIRLRKSPVLVSAMMSAVTESDKWDNRWLAKQRSINKIDCAVALCMAFGAANAVQVRKKPLVLMTLG
jgi:phage terminase large subunit-like protein